MKVRMLLCNNLNNKVLEFDVKKGITVQELLELTKISEISSIIVISNGEVLAKETAIVNEIELKIYPIVMGG